MVTVDGILHLINRLEALVTEGIRVPMTSKSVVDEQEFLEIVDQLRVAIPDEMKLAKRVTVEKDKVIGGARTEAEQIVNAAQQRVASMLNDNEFVKLAEEQAQSIVSEAEATAQQIRDGADAYALEILVGLETELTRLLAQVRRGRAVLEQSTKPGSNGREN